MALDTVCRWTDTEIADCFCNLKRICETYLRGEYEIEVVDLILNPLLAKQDQIVDVPSLVRQLPAPVKKIIGDLADEETVLLGLEVVSISSQIEKT